MDSIVGEVMHSAKEKEAKGASYCPAVTGDTNVGDAIGTHIPPSSNFWRMQLVPTPNHPAKGITHRLVDLEGRYSDIHIGTPKGSQPVVQLKAHGVVVDCLTDAGAEISLISRDCIKYIIETAKLNPYKMNFHPPVNPVCKAANESAIHFIGAVSLPIEREGVIIWIEVQIPRTPLPKPIVLGTNGLMALGYDVVDTLTGKHLLSGKSTTPTRTEGQEIASPVYAIDESVVSAHSISLKQASANVPDGSYLLTRHREEFLVQVEKGRLNIPLQNMEDSSETIASAAVVGQLSSIEEIFTSADIIASAVADELIQQGVVCASEDAEDIWLHIPYEKIIDLLCLDAVFIERCELQCRNNYSFSSRMLRSVIVRHLTLINSLEHLYCLKHGELLPSPEFHHSFLP
jgi:hypothetical protein